MFESHLKPLISFPTLTGSICTFNSQYAGLPLKSHKVAVTATQSGSGTPSPDNVRTINGYSAIHIGNISDNTNINFFQGLLNGTYGFVDLGSLTWYYNNDLNAFYVQDLPIILTGYTNGTKAPMICYEYETVPYYANGAYFEGKDKIIAFAVQAGRRLYVKDTSYGTDTVAFKTAMSGVYLIFKLQTPTTPTITDTQFDTLLTAFGLSGSMFTIQIGSTVNEATYNARTGVLEVTQPSVQTLQLPPCPIDTLEGVNNIWADTGETTLQYIKLG